MGLIFVTVTGSAPAESTLNLNIRNLGDAPLTILGLTIDGPNAEDFAVTSPPAASVPVGGNTTFTLGFLPRGGGGRLAALHITNNDIEESPFDILLAGWAPSIVQFTSSLFEISETGGVAIITVERVGLPGAGAYAEYTIQSGQATEGSDFLGQNGHLPFESDSGKTSLAIEIPILNDALIEGEESLYLTLLNPDPFDTVLGASSTTLFILDNDLGVGFSAGSMTVDETAGTVTVAVTRSGEPTGPVTVEYEVRDGTARSSWVAAPNSETFRVTALPASTPTARSMTVSIPGSVLPTKVVPQVLSVAWPCNPMARC